MFCHLPKTSCYIVGRYYIAGHCWSVVIDPKYTAKTVKCCISGVFKEDTKSLEINLKK